MSTLGRRRKGIETQKQRWEGGNYMDRKNRREQNIMNLEKKIITKIIWTIKGLRGKKKE